MPFHSIAGFVEEIEWFSNSDLYLPDQLQLPLPPDMPTGIHGMPVVGYDGTVYVIGGSDRRGGVVNRGRVMHLM